MEYKLKKVTPGALRTLQANGLLAGDNKDYAQNAINVYLDETKLSEVCEAIFEDFAIADGPEIDLEQVAKGIRSFLTKALGG